MGVLGGNRETYYRLHAKHIKTAVSKRIPIARLNFYSSKYSNS